MGRLSGTCDTQGGAQDATHPELLVSFFLSFSLLTCPQHVPLPNDTSTNYGNVKMEEVNEVM